MKWQVSHLYLWNSFIYNYACKYASLMIVSRFMQSTSVSICLIQVQWLVYLSVYMFAYICIYIYAYVYIYMCNWSLLFYYCSDDRLSCSCHLRLVVWEWKRSRKLNSGIVCLITRSLSYTMFWNASSLHCLPPSTILYSLRLWIPKVRILSAVRRLTSAMSECHSKTGHNLIRYILPGLRCPAVYKSGDIREDEFSQSRNVGELMLPGGHIIDACSFGPNWDMSYISMRDGRSLYR